jgi:hypothetical protein
MLPLCLLCLSLQQPSCPEDCSEEDLDSYEDTLSLERNENGLYVEFQETLYSPKKPPTKPSPTGPSFKPILPLSPWINHGAMCEIEEAYDSFVNQVRPDRIFFDPSLGETVFLRLVSLPNLCPGTAGTVSKSPR